MTQQRNLQSQVSISSYSLQFQAFVPLHNRSWLVWCRLQSVTLYFEVVKDRQIWLPDGRTVLPSEKRCSISYCAIYINPYSVLLKQFKCLLVKLGSGGCFLTDIGQCINLPQFLHILLEIKVGRAHCDKETKLLINREMERAGRTLKCPSKGRTFCYSSNLSGLLLLLQYTEDDA